MQRSGCGIDWVLRDKPFFAFLLFMPLATIERKAGHRRFIVLFLSFIAASVAAQVVFAGLGLSSGRLVGIVPIVLGYMAYSSLMYLWDDGKSKYGGDDDAYDD